MQKFYFSPEYYRQSTEALSIGLESAPLYRAWKNMDPGEGTPIDDRYAVLPALTKEDLRNNFPDGAVPGKRKVDEGLKNGEIEYIETSGTTSEKVTNLWNQSWWNASEAASWKLNRQTAHLNHSYREAQLTSALSVGFRSENDLPMESRILNGRFLFLNEKAGAHEWKPRHYERMAVELAEFKPVVLEANPSYLARLAWWAIDNNIEIYKPQIILFTYELPSEMQLKCIKRVFPVPIASSYGTTEAGYIFMECENGVLHQNTEYCRVDFEPLKEKHGGPEIGRILVSIFNNPWVSLLRFDVGDLARIHPATCRCGRGNGFLLTAIEGRSVNSTFTVDGRLVTTRETDNALSEVEGIRDYRLEQISPEEYSLTVITAPGFENALLESRKALERLYGSGAKVRAEISEDILPGPSGKYRRTQANFEFDIKEFLL